MNAFFVLSNFLQLWIIITPCSFTGKCKLDTILLSLCPKSRFPVLLELQNCSFHFAMKKVGFYLVWGAAFRSSNQLSDVWLVLFGSIDSHPFDLLLTFTDALTDWMLCYSLKEIYCKFLPIHLSWKQFIPVWMKSNFTPFQLQNFARILTLKSNFFVKSFLYLKILAWNYSF